MSAVRVKTQACGMVRGAVAVGINQGLLSQSKVRLPGGDLHISWQGPGKPCCDWPATHVFDGQLFLLITIYNQ